MVTINKVKPMFNMVITTCDKYKDVKLGNTLIDTTKSDTIKEYQKVVAIGPSVKGINVGDVVFINPARYAVMKHKEGSLKDGVIKDNAVLSYKFKTVDIKGVTHLCIYDNDVEYVAEIEEFEENPTIITETKPRLLI